MWNTRNMEHSHFPAGHHEGSHGPDETVGPGRLMTVAEVASILRVSTMTVYRLIKGGDLAAVRVGHGWRISRGAVDRFLDAGAATREGS